MNAKDFNRQNLPEPKTLMEAIKAFADQDVALRFMAALRWPSGEVCCPRCGSLRVRFISTRRVWECREKHPTKRFSIKTGTVMEDSPLPLDKWLCAMWLEANAKNSISSYEVHRALGVTQKSAWFMQQRIRLAFHQGTFNKMKGTVEADETFIGGLARNMHKHKRAKVITSRGGANKAAVMGLLERHSEKGKSRVKTFVVDDRTSATLHPIVHGHVEPGANLMTDELRGYSGLEAAFIHGVINHAEKYVDGAVHTNGMENFWALFKRCIKGTHVSVEPFHLFRYLDAECFRFNERTLNDGQRFLLALGGVTGKRLTYKALIGKNDSQEDAQRNGREEESGAFVN